jgi:hypothetical protein
MAADAGPTGGADRRTRSTAGVGRVVDRRRYGDVGMHRGWGRTLGGATARMSGVGYDPGPVPGRTAVVTRHGPAGPAASSATTLPLHGAPIVTMIERLAHDDPSCG